eukprot:GFUD01013590.1.p1 GENE.GFUD01013590.1~~GFUD01013590.1.p1  ORF type:complete len:374 (+),score=61.88 GFUD01013590.1:240-1361(+)
MPHTSDFIRRVLRESFSDETPCEMCRKKSTNNNNVDKTNGYHINCDQVSSRSATTSSNSITAPNRPLISAKESYMMQKVKSTVPKLSNSMHKGICGRIAVFGGYNMYTGASYFAAISALKCGADLVHIFCEKDAGPVIRTYSPELIVHPTLDQEYGMVEIDAWLPKLDCVVLGHGLGRSQPMLARISIILEKIKQLKLPIVIDGDGLWHVMVSPGILRGYTRAVITPNAEEFTQLVECILNREIVQSVCPDVDTLEDLSRALGNLTIILKGAHDMISDGKFTEHCHAGGSPRRCGSQGDILSGMLATFLHWAYSSQVCKEPGPSIIAGWGACRLARGCSEQGYNMEGRAVTAEDIVKQIHSEFTRLFESETFF